MRGRAITAIHAAKTHCPKGHPYSGSNLYIEPKSGSRRCRRCDYEKHQRYRDRMVMETWTPAHDWDAKLAQS
jgi:hypothetical protein